MSGIPRAAEGGRGASAPAPRAPGSFPQVLLTLNDDCMERGMISSCSEGVLKTIWWSGICLTAHYEHKPHLINTRTASCGLQGDCSRWANGRVFGTCNLCIRALKLNLSLHNDNDIYHNEIAQTTLMDCSNTIPTIWGRILLTNQLYYGNGIVTDQPYW